ncbi:MAG: hypothetical protein HRF43_07450 [Phycisphaerae bacterium]
MSRCNAGDAAAFETLYLRDRDGVTGLALRFIGEPNDSHDVLQEAFTCLPGKFPGFRLTARMTTFHDPVVKNTASRIQRQRRRAGPPSDCGMRVSDCGWENLPRLGAGAGVRSEDFAFRTGESTIG